MLSTDHISHAEYAIPPESNQVSAEVVKNPENSNREATIASLAIGRARVDVDSYLVASPEVLTPKEIQLKLIARVSSALFEARRYKLDSEFSVPIVSAVPAKGVTPNDYELTA